MTDKEVKDKQPDNFHMYNAVEIMHNVEEVIKYHNQDDKESK